MSAEPVMPPRYAGRWLGADRRLIFEVSAGTPPRVTATDQRGRKRVDAAPATYAPATKLDSRVASERLDTLHVELGTKGLGTTLRLMFAVENRDPAHLGGLPWVHVPEGTEPAAIRMHPEQGGSYYAAVLSAWDDSAEAMTESEGSWLRPYSVYALAPP
jgi:hypothetical protein